MSIADMMQKDYEDEAEWAGIGHYAGECPNCGRQRLMKCQNGKHRCEKCDWCPELGAYAPVRRI